VLSTDLDNDAKLGKTSHPGVIASLYYAGETEDEDNGATIAPDNCFPSQAVWTGGNPNRLPICVAKKVKFSFDPGTEVKISSGGNYVTLTEDAEIEISNNIPKKKGNHFHGYKNLATNATIFEPKKKGPLLICFGCQPKRVNEPQADPDLDCSNSHFP
jgi:hypothetical protein